MIVISEKLFKRDNTSSKKKKTCLGKVDRFKHQIR